MSINCSEQLGEIHICPVCVGFGISTPEQARQVGALADEVIVGSGCVKTIGGSETSVETPKQFAADIHYGRKQAIVTEGD